MGKGGYGKGKSQSKGKSQRQNTRAPQGVTPGPDEVATELFIPANIAGKVIGKSGKNIQALKYQTGVRVLEVQQRGQDSVAVIVGQEQSAVAALQYLQGLIQSDMRTQLNHGASVDWTYPSPPQTTDAAVAETTDAPRSPPKVKASIDKAKVVEPRPEFSPPKQVGVVEDTKKPVKAVEDTPESDKDSSQTKAEDESLISANSSAWLPEVVQSSVDKVRALPRKWQIAGGAVVGAGTVAPAAGVGGAVAGGVGGLMLAPFTLGLSVPVGVVVGGGAGFTGGAVTGAAAGAGMTAYLTREEIAAEAA
jgi:predicted RNA-binding protein YlqC (UPF0109 family)